MALRLKLRPAARGDADAAQDWYDDAAPGLGNAFTDEFLSALAFLVEHPSVGSRRYAHLLPDESLRVWSFDRFPFLVFYRVSGDVLDVVRVLHERRDIVASLIAH
ncbi:type II toxin-antitoxin system RelE/ParE family toxin [Cupriavidus alkaliphilus]|uniref:type II toxin-antitoxin system RelE/ParE family toxin n=1 Tax=Cupriavidus alkaliphilus TaxID=942866 RepID=UPI000DC3FFCA|nr:type II toxin-antitoxin system RelE/ParE family toxin [Cupriavidus alkaliphilus]MBB3015965.1 toxin ParE1/3/4 [Cupriavidus alkaliphilus]RAS05021.1 toxin ParE1/3/4 [Cupriavidus alkaliphilus]